MLAAQRLEQALAALGFERAEFDTPRAVLLMAIRDFAEAVLDPALAAAATAKMPAADPFTPPAQWLEGFVEGFRALADEDCGTDPMNARNCGVMLWQMQSDEWRRERTADLRGQGRADGEEEARGQNAST